MPKFDGSDPDAGDIWQYASNTYSSKSRGEVFVVKGESLRSGNVWEVFISRISPSGSIDRRSYDIPERRSTYGSRS